MTLHHTLPHDSLQRSYFDRLGQHTFQPTEDFDPWDSVELSTQHDTSPQTRLDNLSMTSHRSNNLQQAPEFQTQFFPMSDPFNAKQYFYARRQLFQSAGVE